jgi:hypothetical protein
VAEVRLGHKEGGSCDPFTQEDAGRTPAAQLFRVHDPSLSTSSPTVCRTLWKISRQVRAGSPLPRMPTSRSNVSRLSIPDSSPRSPVLNLAAAHSSAHHCQRLPSSLLIENASEQPSHPQHPAPRHFRSRLTASRTRASSFSPYPLTGKWPLHTGAPPPVALKSTSSTWREVTFAHQIYDSAATAAFFLVCELAGKGDASSLKVLLSRSEPRDVTLYRQAFGARLFLIPRRPPWYCRRKYLTSVSWGQTRGFD